MAALFYGKVSACQTLVRTVGGSNGKWDNNVAISMLWWYDHSDHSHVDSRNATYYDVTVKVAFTSNGGPSEYCCLFPRLQPQGWY